MKESSQQQEQHKHQEHHEGIPSARQSSRQSPRGIDHQTIIGGKNPTIVAASVSAAATSTAVVVPYWVKIVSGSVGSMITAFAVTPLEVVKVRQQAQPHNSSSSVSSSATGAVNVKTPSNVSPCPRGCGTFVFNNGLGECLLPRNAVPYFDKITGEILPTKMLSCNTTPTRRTKFRRSTNPNGTFQMLRRIFATEGLSGIYAGLAPTLVMGVPNTVLYFITYEELASRLRQHHDDFGSDNASNHVSSSSSSFVTAWAPALAGGSARFIASASTAPLELIRTRQAARIGSGDPLANGGSGRSGMVQELASIIRNEGFFALYRGLSPTLFRDVPFSAVYWLCIESMREQWRQRNEYHHPVSTLQQLGQGLVNGSVSGMIAAACTTPLDVVKTRRQTEVFQLSTTATSKVAETARVLETETAAAISCDHAGAAVYHHPKISSSSGSGGGGVGTNTNNVATRGTIQMLNDIFREEGVRGLWRGNQARMIKVAPACAIMISSYEVGKQLLAEEF